MNLARDAFGEYVNSREYQQFRKSQVESVPPSGHLDREKAREVLRRRFGVRVIDEGELLAALEGCVVPDPRLARLNDLCDERDPSGHGSPFEHSIWPHEVRAILGGGPA